MLFMTLREGKGDKKRERISRIIERVLIIAGAFVKYHRELNRSCISSVDPAILFFSLSST